MRAPVSLVNSSSGWKSRIACSTGIGMKSCTWKASDLRSSSGRQPRQVDLADDDLLVRHADDDLLGAELRLRPQLADGGGDRVGVDDLAVAHGAGGQGDLTEALERGAALAERQLGGADTGRPDVESDYWSSCHCASPRAAADGREVPARRPTGVLEDASDGGAGLEHAGDAMCAARRSAAQTTGQVEVARRPARADEDGDQRRPSEHEGTERHGRLAAAPAARDQRRAEHPAEQEARGTGRPPSAPQPSQPGRGRARPAA